MKSGYNANDLPIILMLVLAILGGLVEDHGHRVAGHGMMLDPPARASMWRFGFNTPINYDDNGLNCGGRAVILHVSYFIELFLKEFLILRTFLRVHFLCQLSSYSVYTLFSGATRGHQSRSLRRMWRRMEPSPSATQRRRW